jgi:DNA-binding transcriptional LysR family regulator
MMIELRRLRYLVVLANRLSYSQAANELGLSQSALTRAIQSLEREVGMRLFDRGQSGVRLTDQGRWMVEKAASLLVDASEFNRQVSNASRGREGRVRFGMTPLAANSLLPTMLGGRLARLPNFAHDAVVRDTERLSLMLAKGELEFLVCEEWVSSWALPDGLSVVAEPIAGLRIALVVRAGHPARDFGALNEPYPLVINSTVAPWGKLAAELALQGAGAVQLVEEIGAAAELARRSDILWLCCPHMIASQIRAGEFCDLGLPAAIAPKSLELSIYRIDRRSLSRAAQDLQAAVRSALAG